MREFKKYKGIYIIIVILLNGLTHSYSQVSFNISGTVYNENKNAIPFATVAIENTNIGTACDQNGAFQIRASKPGDITLIISSIGYVTKKIFVKTAKSDISIDVELSQSSQELEEVKAKALGKAKQMKQKGFAINSIEAKEIEHKSVELNALLQNTPGVTVRQDGGVGSNTTYSINGISGRGVRFFIDGVPSELMGASYSVSSIPVSLIERIEIYKGVVPAEFGSDALGGAINIITKRKPHQSVSASLSAGSFNTYKSSLFVSSSNKDGLVASISSFYNYSDNSYDIWGNYVAVVDDNPASPTFGKETSGLRVKRFHDSYKSYGTKVDAGVKNKQWADQLLFGLNYTAMDKDIQHGATMRTPYGERTAGQQLLMPSLTYAKYKLFLEGLDVSTHFAYSQNERQVVDTTTNMYNWHGNEMHQLYPSAGEASSPTLSKTKLKSYLNKTNISYRFGKKNKLGVNILYSDLSSESKDDLDDVIRKNTRGSRNIRKTVLSINYQFATNNNKLTILAMSKYFGQNITVNEIESELDDNNSIIYTPYALTGNPHYWGYGFTSNYRPNQWLSLSFSGEKALRLPTSNELFGNATTNTVSSFTLKPEQSNNFNLGLNLMPLINSNNTINIDVNLFYRQVKDKIMRSLTASEEDFQYKNFSKVLNKGIDISTQYTFHKQMKFELNGSYLDARYLQEYSETGARNAHYKNRMPNTPFFNLGAFAQYTISQIGKNQLLNLSADYQYNHWYYRHWEVYAADGKAIIPTQHIFNGSIAYTFSLKKQKITWSFDLTNIGNEQVFDNYAKQKPGRAFYTKLLFTL